MKRDLSIRPGSAPLLPADVRVPPAVGFHRGAATLAPERNPWKLSLEALSDQLTALVRGAQEHVVRVEDAGGAASGVAWSADGIVVTAHHVLDRDEEIEIGLPSGETVGAEVVGRDPTTDLAALRVRRFGSPAAAGRTRSSRPGAPSCSASRARAARGPRWRRRRAAGEYRGGRGGRIDRFLETTLELHAGVSGGPRVRGRGADRDLPPGSCAAPR